MQKSPHFLTHSDAIAGFTSQSLGLLAYACKTDSLTTIKLAPRMHKNLSFWAQKSKASSPRPSPLGRVLGRKPLGRGTPRPHILSPSAPSVPRSSHSPWFVPHFLNRGYAPDRLNRSILQELIPMLSDSAAWGWRTCNPSLTSECSMCRRVFIEPDYMSSLCRQTTRSRAKIVLLWRFEISRDRDLSNDSCSGRPCVSGHFDVY